MNPGPTLRRCCWFAILLPALQTTELRSAETQASGSVPYPTGSHFQLVREFFTTADGLPAGDIRAVAVTRDGIVLVSAGKGVARLESERWVEQTGPAEVTALFGPVQGPSGLAGATNGVWALNGGQWQREEGSPAGVIAFAAEPDGVPWALAPSGVWRRGDTWKLIHDVDDDAMKGPRSFLPTGPEDVFVASATGLYGLLGPQPVRTRRRQRLG